MSEKYNVSKEEKIRQAEFADKVKTVLAAEFYECSPKAFIHTYGCQGNVSDSERIMGMLKEMGYEFTNDASKADLILYNTCAVREHAEDRVFGNVGAVKKYKKDNPHLIIALCGCMMQQEHIRNKIYSSYPFVDLVFGTHAVTSLRDRGIKALLPIMYGCDNFCTYCIVPYVRGRERSREPQAVLNEAEDIIANGYKDITLLGQNVNSYGKNNVSDMNFAGLLREVANLDGDFWVRFMTSHPKDCTKELIDVMAENDKIAKHLHLPFQSGNDRVLKAMNRHYDRKKYLELINYAKEKIPGLSLTSDVIVGFPGETYEEFKDTLSLIKEVEFTSLFTFIYSPREGTKAASMEDPVTKDEKSRWFKELCDLQESIASKRTAKMKDNIYKVLVESESKNHPGMLSGRTEGNIIIEFSGDSSLIGSFRNVKVTEPLNWILKGELQQ